MFSPLPCSGRCPLLTVELTPVPPMVLTTITSLSYGLLGDPSPKSTCFIQVYAMSEGWLAPLHRSGLAARWQAGGVRWVAFFQDTNGLVFRGLPAALGRHWMGLG